MLKNEHMLAIGMISMAVGILIGRFVEFEYAGFSVSSFLEGILIGMSITLNVVYMIRINRKNNQNS